MSRSGVLVLCGLFLISCAGDDTAEDPGNNPDDNTVTPQPLPIPDDLVPPLNHLIYLSAPTNGNAVAAGIAPAVQTGTGIVVSNLDRNETFESSLCLNKSFLLDVSWAPNETMQCQSKDADGVSQAVPLMLPSSVTIDKPTVDEPSLVAGKVIIKGKTNGARLVLVGSRATSCVTSVETTDGVFEATLEAKAGDRLVVFVVDSETRDPSPAVEVTVPP